MNKAEIIEIIENELERDKNRGWMSEGAKKESAGYQDALEWVLIILKDKSL